MVSRILGVSKGVFLVGERTNFGPMLTVHYYTYRNRKMIAAGIMVLDFFLGGGGQAEIWRQLSAVPPDYALC